MKARIFSTAHHLEEDEGAFFTGPSWFLPLELHKYWQMPTEHRFPENALRRAGQ
jgi:hypothetical protein